MRSEPLGDHDAVLASGLDQATTYPPASAAPTNAGRRVGSAARATQTLLLQADGLRRDIVGCDEQVELVREGR